MTAPTPEGPSARPSAPDGPPEPASAPHIIQRLASSQHGVVARRQLLSAGVAPHVVDRRLREGWLQGVHRGIYRVGPVAAPHAREMAACLACGPAAVVSHRSAAVLRGILPPRPGPATVDVSVTHGVRPRSGIQVHRVVSLPPGEVTRVHGIPATAVSRTLLDLAAVARPRELEQAVASALESRLVTHEQLRRLAAKHGGRCGMPALRGVLGGRAALTRSEAEERFLDLVRRAQLPPPHANASCAGHEVDFLWRRERLVVEIDGFAYHRSRRAFERDRRRDAVLVAAGFRVVRVTWRQLLEEPEALLVRLGRALAVAAAR